ncbi:hypothetical protein [uncultured Cohaesibacter sp.]|uniref:hypothetical protein n=1 Tax=uncultured Cohaesibacter sp. TaxID=1002546 RepID=UPI0029C80497|nr:hypothetical protein [uncultured Cohaesibacter sp.]
MVDLAKVKRNVKRMVDQGAPESEIDEYISTEGTTIDAVRAAPLTSAKGVGSAVGDFFKHTATNALDTLSLGWNDEAAAGLAALPALMPGGESYSQAYDRLHKGQQRLVDEADQDMAAKVAGQTIGLAPAMLATAGMPAMASAARAAPQLTGAPGMAKTALDAVRPAATTGGRIVQGATYGGAAGGAFSGRPRYGRWRLV